jgi:putative photosynthetic complex assembly protein
LPEWRAPTPAPPDLEIAMSALDTEPFPRGALVAVALLLGLSVAGTAAFRLAHLNSAAWNAAPRAQLWNSEDLRFVDETDGSVIVRDSQTDRVVATLTPGTGAFVRGVMRGLVHERKVRGIGPTPPFRLSEWEGGRLELEDTATGRRIDLEAFGNSNRDAFLKLLQPRGAQS